MEQRRIPLASFDRLICDYTANLENILNFDIKMAKRADLTSKTLKQILSETKKNPVEGNFDLDRVRHVE